MEPYIFYGFLIMKYFNKRVGFRIGATHTLVRRCSIFKRHINYYEFSLIRITDSQVVVRYLFIYLFMFMYSGQLQGASRKDFVFRSKNIDWH